MCERERERERAREREKKGEKGRERVRERESIYLVYPRSISVDWIDTLTLHLLAS